MNKLHSIELFLKKFETFDTHKLVELSFKAYENNILNIPLNSPYFSIKNNNIETQVTGWEKDLMTRDLEQPIEPDNIVIVGESIARFYGLDPLTNFKKILLESSNNKNIIDLSITGQKMEDVLTNCHLIKDIKPSKLIVMIGNNNFSLFFINHMTILECLRKDNDFKSTLKTYYKNFIFKPLINRLLKETNLAPAKVLFVIPKMNKSWHPQEKFYNQIDHIDFDFKMEFHPYKNFRIPGLGSFTASAYREVLNELSCQYVDMHDLNLIDDDFIDYCHLRPSGLHKLIPPIFKFLNIISDINLEKFDINAGEAEYLQRKIFRHSVDNLPQNSTTIKIDALFSGSPIMLHPEYYELTKLSHLNPILSPIDITQSFSIEKNKTAFIKNGLNNLLENKFYKNIDTRVMPDNYHKRIFLSIHQESLQVVIQNLKKCNAKISIEIQPHFNNLELSFNHNFSYKSQILLNTKNHFEIDLDHGENIFEIHIKNRIEVPSLAKQFKYLNKRHFIFPAYTITRFSINI